METREDARKSVLLDLWLLVRRGKENDTKEEVFDLLEAVSKG